MLRKGGCDYLEEEKKILKIPFRTAQFHTQREIKVGDAKSLSGTKAGGETLLRLLPLPAV